MVCAMFSAADPTSYSRTHVGHTTPPGPVKKNCLLHDPKDLRIDALHRKALMGYQSDVKVMELDASSAEEKEIATIWS